MSPSPQKLVDYDALAAQARGEASSASASVDYDALAAQAAGHSTPAETAQNTPPSAGPVSRFVSGVAETLNPLPLITMLTDRSQVDPDEAALLQGAGAPPGLGNVVRSVVQAQRGEWQKAKHAYETGHYGDAVMYALSTAAPVVGPTATHFGETVKQGNYAGAAGQAIGLAAPLAVSELKIAPKKLTPALKNPNAQEALALQYAQSQGIPMDAGTVTGSPVVRGAQYVADRTLAAAPSVAKATERQTQALRQTASDLSARAGAAQTPETAGQAIQARTSQVVSDLHAQANAAYDRLRALEPANTVEVQIGTKASPSGLVKDAVPVMERQAFPVDMRAVKAALKPVWDRMRRQMPVTQQQASPGLKAIENIMTGPDVAPATVVDLDLSAIKAIARQADRPELRDLGQGLAASTVKRLDMAVQAAVAKGGPEATAALAAGRKATRAKYLAAEIADDLAKEPVKAYRQATQPKDAGIAQLRELQTLAPKELPKIGRAFLEDLFEPTMREGGFQKAGTAFEKWESLGPQTKSLIVPDVRLRTQITRFLQAAKKLQENPNPSGSGGIVSIGSQLGSFALNVPAALTAQVGGLTLSRALRNPRVLQLLTDGLTIKPGTVTSKAWVLTMANLIRQDDKKDTK